MVRSRLAARGRFCCQNRTEARHFRSEAAWEAKDSLVRPCEAGYDGYAFMRWKMITDCIRNRFASRHGTSSNRRRCIAFKYGGLTKFMWDSKANKQAVVKHNEAITNCSSNGRCAFSDFRGCVT
ncbi:hypothetical protein NECAME_07824 [Necator americanus]|uniref:Uncharacterized protein n=1 Tax=Necator americanus TaxID=51031 RepID=W2TLS6_NECAM|nr:hypothetical protein NECAME_07824 [Necator americanus]ETN82713.1 hypothetical protein NECAME_07824 [Necator americanus]